MEPKRKPQGPNGDWVQIDVDGGYLKWSKTLRRCDAHCTVVGHGGPSKCKMDCTIGGQRPVARQAAWLCLGSMADIVGDRPEHVALKPDIGTADYLPIRRDAREGMVERAAYDPQMRALLEDEGDIMAPEPEEVPYGRKAKS